MAGRCRESTSSAHGEPRGEGAWSGGQGCALGGDSGSRSVDNRPVMGISQQPERAAAASRTRWRAVTERHARLGTSSQNEGGRKGGRECFC